MESQNVFKEAKNRLQGLQDAESQYEKELGRKCDWDDPEDVSEYRRWRRKNRRESKLPFGGKCPHCDEVKVVSRSWVVKRNFIGCRSCYFRKIYQNPPVDVGVLEEVFGEVEIRVAVDGESILRAREKSGLSRAEFSRRCGWSVSWQRNIENGRAQSITGDNADTILQVLQEAGILTKDDPENWGTHDE